MMHSNCRISCLDEPPEKKQLKEQTPETVAQENNGGSDGVDRISRLHLALCHQIMSLLPILDVVSISTLSKTFRSLWSSFPIIDFDQKLFDVDIPGNLDWNRPITSTGMFLDFVTDSIQLRRLETSLEKFSLRCYLSDVESDVRIDSAINFAVANNVKELVLRFVGKDMNDEALLYYYFKEEFSPKFATSLKLRGFQLNLSSLLLTCNSMESLTLHKCLVWGDTNSPNDQSYITACKSLRLVSFVNLQISEDWIDNHVPRFKNVEMLELSQCPDLTKITISHENVKEIKLEDNVALESVKIVAPALHSFLMVGRIERVCMIDIISCKLVKNLSLSRVFITEEWLKAHIYGFKHLESLRLEKCLRLRRIEIVSKRLRCLELCDCTNLVEVEVDTPNLVSFAYAGSSVSFTLMNTPRLRNPTLRLRSSGTTVQWFSQLRNMLTMFDHCESMTLICKAEDLIFPEDLRESRLSPLYDIRMLQINLSSGTRIETELVKNVLWVTPLLETLCFTSNSTEKFIKLRYNWRTPIDEETSCCRYLPIKCWRHALRKVEMRNIEDSDGRDGILEYFLEECQFAGNSTRPMLELQQTGM